MRVSISDCGLTLSGMGAEGLEKHTKNHPINGKL